MAKRKLILPKPLLERVCQIPVRRQNQRDKYLKIADTILNECDKKKQTYDVYLPVPSTFWQKHIAKHYERYLKPLIAENVIVTTGIYSNYPGTTFCKEYKINRKLLSTDMSVVSSNEDITDAQCHSQISEKCPNCKICKKTRKILDSMKLDLKAAKKEVEEFIRFRKYCSKISIDENILHTGSIKISNPSSLGFQLSDQPQYLTVEIAKQLAKERGLSLIKDGSKYLVNDIDSYLDLKDIQIARSWLCNIYKINNNEYYAKRNSTNKRLDTNFTNLPSKLLKYFKISDKQFVSLDLKNSQFTILASMINDGYFNKMLNGISTTDNQQLNNHEIINRHSKDQSNLDNDNSIESYNLADTYMSSTTKLCNVKCSLITMDLNEFIVLARNGKLYEFIRDELELANGATGRKEEKK